LKWFSFSKIQFLLTFECSLSQTEPKILENSLKQNTTMRTFALIAILCIIIVSTLVFAYVDHEHYHGVVSKLAKDYEGPVHELNWELLDKLLPNAHGAQDVCGTGGEFRRKHDCISVKHTKKDVCCWHSRDDSVGILPYSCCGVGWHEHKCEKIIEQLCTMYNGQEKAALAYGREMGAKIKKEQEEAAAAAKLAHQKSAGDL
jgi:hypothetical protein